MAVSVTTSGSIFNRLKVIEEKLRPESVGLWMNGPATEYFQQRALDRFASQGDDVSGGAWKALKKSTQDRREWEAQKFGYNISGKRPINVRSGQLHEWVTDNVAGGEPVPEGWHYMYPLHLPRDGTMATKLETAQKGKDSNDAPPRPVLGVSVVDAEIVTSMMESWLSVLN